MAIFTFFTHSLSKFLTSLSYLIKRKTFLSSRSSRNKEIKKRFWCQTWRKDRLLRISSESSSTSLLALFRLGLTSKFIIISELLFRTFSCFFASPPRSRVPKASFKLRTISAGDRGRLKRGIFFSKRSKKHPKLEPRGD